MAIYNLAKGGYAPEYGTCKDCDCGVDERGLPIWLQPDLRSDGGYAFRDKVEWKQLMNMLEVRYGKFADELEVGDQLMIFLQPNHATVKSLFVDFFEPAEGFKFSLKTADGKEFKGKQQLVKYTEKNAVESAEETESVDTATVESRTQWVSLVEDGYNAKVDAVVLEIEAVPKKGLHNEIKMLFGRRFEQDGFMLPARIV